jgi:hypothetical protein
METDVVALHPILGSMAGGSSWEEDVGREEQEGFEDVKE